MKEITLKAVVENIAAVTEHIDAELMAIDCPMKLQMQIDVAIDEIFSNIAHYAYGEDGGDVTVRFEYDPQTDVATIIFMDRGIPFNSLDRGDPDVTLPAEKRAIGGLGVFLVKKLMDEVTYEHRDGMNIMRMTKKIH